MKRNHLSSIQSQNMYVRARPKSQKMGIIAMRVRIDLRDTTTLIKRKKSNVNQRELEREREKERDLVERERIILISHNIHVVLNVGMNFISIFTKFSAIML